MININGCKLYAVKWNLKPIFEEKNIPIGDLILFLFNQLFISGLVFNQPYPHPPSHSPGPVGMWLYFVLSSN